MSGFLSLGRRKCAGGDEFTESMTGYFYNYDFRPFVTAIPVREGVKPKGAVVLMAGGAYQFRGRHTGRPVFDGLR